MQLWALLLAAGQGSRLREATDGTAKQFLEWHGEPLYLRSARTLARCARLRGLVFVFPGSNLEAETRRLTELSPDLGLPWLAVAGGERRQDSVRLGLAGLAEVDSTCDAVLVHDTARPFLSPGLINRIIDALEQGEAGVIPGLTPSDTIKQLDEDGIFVENTPDRSRLAAVQTPQGFRLAALTGAHERAETERWEATDDASLLERCGLRIRVVPGEAENIKITTPADLIRLMQPTVPLPRVGYGYDVHRYAAAGEGRPLRLGGVAIPSGPGVLAHSDGDVLLHAVADALLGCIAGGDIGQLFPDSDPAFEGICSAVLLDEVLRRVLCAGLCVTHLDMTVIAQVPKVAPHRDAIRKNMARLTGLALENISLKATTEEGLGFTGTRQGIKAVAVATACRRPSSACPRDEPFPD